MTAPFWFQAFHLKKIKIDAKVSSMYIRNTKKEDILSVLAIYKKEIRHFEKNNESFDSERLDNLVLNDIYSDASYVLIDDNQIKAVYTLKKDETEKDSPVYELCRFAVKDKHKGYASYCIRNSFYQVRRIRIKVNRTDVPFISLLEKFNFIRCDEITSGENKNYIIYLKEASFSDLLLYFYEDYGRVLPWRENVTFYHTYLSEIMLQQTRVEAVKKYYDRFLSILPTLNDLANAEEDVYLKLWEGLGYYSRVKNLHKGAQYIVEQKELPSTYEELIKVPGIGDYTAKAILSIVFKKDYIALDGNLMRIYSRLTCDEKDIQSKEAKLEADAYFLSLLKERPGDFNQALMDLGESVCLPNSMPKCHQCPIRYFCQSYSLDNPLNYPKKKEKMKKKVEKKTIFIIKYKDTYLIIKREENALLGSLYGFLESNQIDDINEAFSFLEKKEFKIESIEKTVNAKHVFSHIIWNMNGYLVVLKEKPKDFLFVTKEEIRNIYSIPSAYKKYKSLILEGKF